MDKLVAYYNENDPVIASWLIEVIAAKLIAPGIVDQRSIEDVTPNDLRGFTQYHFFAGIGIWSLGLRIAGWPDDRAICTGSCPCQPFSQAGKGIGFDDERHLWPSWHYLIERSELRNIPVVGEQVASPDGLNWFDLVSTDMEGTGYTIGAIDTCAAGFGAPFIGQRLYWMAAPNGWKQRNGKLQSGGEYRQQPQNGRNMQTGFWQNVEWLVNRNSNGKLEYRPIEPGSFPLVNGGALRNRLDAVRGAGNSLNIAQAKAFIETVMEIL